MLKKIYPKRYFSIFILQAWLMMVYAAETSVEPIESIIPERTIRIMHVDSNQNDRDLFNHLITTYNAQSTSTPRIIPSFLADGDQITLKALGGIHLVLCSIQMTNEHGDVALLRLIREARRSGFELPPFMAVTDDTQYHNQGYEQSLLAKASYFIGGCDKFQDPQDSQVITNILEYCRMKLGDNWLEERVGRFRISRVVSEAVQDLLEVSPLPSIPPSPSVQPSPRTIIASSVDHHRLPLVPPGDLPEIFEVAVGQETPVIVTVTPARSFRMYTVNPRAIIHLPIPTRRLEGCRASERKASLSMQRYSCWQLFLNCFRSTAIAPA